MKEDKAKELKDYCSSLFYNIVKCYCVFIFNLVNEVDYDPTNLSFQRKYDEMMAELYSFCNCWRDSIELKSIYFHLKVRPDIKTGTIYFNYDNPKEFVDQKNMRRLNDEINDLDLENDFVEHVTLDNGNDITVRPLNAVCQPKVVCESLGSNEDFRFAVETNNIGGRLNALLQNKTDHEQVKSLPTIRFSKKRKRNRMQCLYGRFQSE